MEDEFGHDPDCPLYGTGLPPAAEMIVGKVVPSVPGSRMRHGGPFEISEGLTIGTDEWRRMRCGFCGEESMTPLEVIPPFALQDTDGSYLGHCMSCQHDMQQGYRPGHNPNRRRRRRR